MFAKIITTVFVAMLLFTQTSYAGWFGGDKYVADPTIQIAIFHQYGAHAFYDVTNRLLVVDANYQDPLAAVAVDEDLHAELSRMEEVLNGASGMKASYSEKDVWDLLLKQPNAEDGSVINISRVVSKIFPNQRDAELKRNREYYIAKSKPSLNEALLIKIQKQAITLRSPEVQKKIEENLIARGKLK